MVALTNATFLITPVLETSPSKPPAPNLAFTIECPLPSNTPLNPFSTLICEPEASCSKHLALITASLSSTIMSLPRTK